MLRITIELVPHGLEEFKKPLAQATISNIGTADPKLARSEVCNYAYEVTDDRGNRSKGTINSYPRAQGCVDLVAYVFERAADDGVGKL